MGDFEISDDAAKEVIRELYTRRIRESLNDMSEMCGKVLDENSELHAQGLSLDVLLENLTKPVALLGVMQWPEEADTDEFLPETITVLDQIRENMSLDLRVICGRYIRAVAEKKTSFRIDMEVGVARPLEESAQQEYLDGRAIHIHLD